MFIYELYNIQNMLFVLRNILTFSNLTIDLRRHNIGCQRFFMFTIKISFSGFRNFQLILSGLTNFLFMLLYFAMENPNIEQQDLKKMIADYMEAGMLDNIIDMFKYDSSLYDYISYLLTDERMRVRIGTTALLETLSIEDSDNAKKAIPQVISLLKHSDPVLRGDAAYLLGTIGDKTVIPYLEELANDENENVRIIASEAIQDIESKHKTE